MHISSLNTIPAPKGAQPAWPRQRGLPQPSDRPVNGLDHTSHCHFSKNPLNFSKINPQSNGVFSFRPPSCRRAGRRRSPLSPHRPPGAGPPFRPAPAATPSFLPARPIETWIEAHAKRQQQLSPCRPPFLLSPRAKRRAPAPLLPRAGGDRSPACAAEGRVRRRWLRTGNRGRGLDPRKERQARTGSRF